MKPGNWLCAASLAMLLAGEAFAHGRIESLALLDKIRPGATTAQQVRELLGPPANVMHFPARGIDTLEYEAREYTERFVISISIGPDGVVREVMRLRLSATGGGM